MSGENGARGGSHLDWLRARNAALKADHVLDKDVPGYDGRLVIRYGQVPWSVVSKFQSVVANDRDGSALLAANSDVLITACREVLFRADDDTLGPVDPSGEPLRVGPELATLLGAENVTSARAALRWLFPSELAISMQAGELLAWTQDAMREDHEVLLGE